MRNNIGKMILRAGECGIREGIVAKEVAGQVKNGSRGRCEGEFNLQVSFIQG